MHQVLDNEDDNTDDLLTGVGIERSNQLTHNVVFTLLEGSKSFRKERIMPDTKKKQIDKLNSVGYTDIK